MFTFIAGFQPKTRVLDDERRMCPDCGKMTLRRQRLDHMLSVFFIPLFAVERGEPTFFCPECGFSAGEEGAEGPAAKSRSSGSCPGCGRRLERDFVYCPRCGRRV